MLADGFSFLACAITIEFEPTPRADDLSASDLPPGKVVQLAQEVADQCSATAHLGGYITSDIISIQDPLGSRKEHREFCKNHTRLLFSACSRLYILTAWQESSGR